ncbi:MAG: PaaI family thioesterase [Chloroflexi bacterium]|nr:PaaI family thioesterase [Chloroflexota bacterium]
MPARQLKRRLDAVIEKLDHSQQARLLDWAKMIDTSVTRVRTQAGSTGPLGDALHISSVSSKDGRAVYRQRVTADLLNPHGVLHGGAVYTMVDYAMGSAVMSLLPPGDTCATIEMKVSYLAPVRDGTLRCDTRVIKLGRRVAFLESRVTHRRKPVATATGSFAIIRAGER